MQFKYILKTSIWSARKNLVSRVVSLKILNRQWTCRHGTVLDFVFSMYWFSHPSTQAILLADFIVWTDKLPVNRFRFIQFTSHAIIDFFTSSSSIQYKTFVDGLNFVILLLFYIVSLIENKLNEETQSPFKTGHTQYCNMTIASRSHDWLAGSISSLKGRV